MRKELYGARLRRIQHVSFLLFGLCALVAVMLLTGEKLKDEARQVWQAQAMREAEGITNEGMAWLQLFQSDLRSLATVFHASVEVDPNEFLDALDLIEDRDVATPVATWCMAQVVNYDKKDVPPSLRVVLSSEKRGLLAVGHDLSVIKAMREAANDAFANDGRVSAGQIYKDSSGKQKALFAITAPYNGHEGVLFSSIDLGAFFRDLASLHVPGGLHLEQVELLHIKSDEERGAPLLLNWVSSTKSVYTFDYLTQSSGARWRFIWALEPDFGNGPALGLGRFVQGGGSVIAILLFALFLHLSRENFRVNELVTARTAALKEALAEAGRANEKLEQISRLDSLTGLPNRRNLDEFLAREWGNAQRERSCFAVAILDIDFFKAYNDSLGHLAGDDCLKEVASLLKTAVFRPSDLLVRYGGEEFLCVLPGTGQSGIETICQRLRLAVAQAKLPHPDSIISSYVSISVGAACCIAAPGKDVDDLIATADRLLYEAKATGRDRYCVSCLCDEAGK